jgi:hypothetical protein
MSDPIKALLDLKQALPNLDWSIGSDNVLRMSVWLTESDAQLLRDGQEMFAPRNTTQHPPVSGLALHEFVEPPTDRAWGDFCWQWNNDEVARCGWTRADHQEVTP